MALTMPSIFMPQTSQKHPCFKLYKRLDDRRLVRCCGSSTSEDDVSLSEQPLEPLPLKNSAETYLKSKAQNKLEVGTPIIVTESPRYIKTATAMPSLRVNSGHINAGDVGRIMSRKPKDVWAVRFRIGTYLIDGKYFEALELEEPSV